jgi:hypothetical protein
MLNKPKLFLTTLLLTSLTLPAHAEDLLEEKPTTANNISIQLPKTWLPDDSKDTRPLLRARAPARDKDDTGEFQTLLWITADTGNKIDGKALQTRAAKDYTNYKPTEEPTDVTVGDLKGVKLGGTFTVGSVKLRTRQYFLQKDDKIYTLTVMSLESKWPTYAPAIEAAIASFRIPAK